MKECLLPLKHTMPVYIITNGGPEDQWAALTIMGYRDYITGVYGCGMSSRYSDRTELNKYECIKEIMQKHGLDCQSSTPLGYLYDDNESENSQKHQLCPSIRFRKVTKDESIIGEYEDNVFVNRISSQLEKHNNEQTGKTDCTCMINTDFDELTDEIKAGNVKIVFDWDCTFQSHEGQLPYHLIANLQEEKGYGEDAPIPKFLKQVNIKNDYIQLTDDKTSGNRGFNGNISSNCSVKKELQ